MTRLYEQQRNMGLLRSRAWIVPVASTVAGSALALLPMVALSPSLPPFGLLMLLGWRLLRPELWQPWIGLPLGLIDDLVAGQPLGTSMALWTACLLVIEPLDNRLLWRDYWGEWLLAGGAILLFLVAAWEIDAIGGTRPALPLLLPQAITAILCFPVASRLCAILDGWRLAR